MRLQLGANVRLLPSLIEEVSNGRFGRVDEASGKFFDVLNEFKLLGEFAATHLHHVTEELAEGLLNFIEKSERPSFERDEWMLRVLGRRKAWWQRAEAHLERMRPVAALFQDERRLKNFAITAELAELAIKENKRLPFIETNFSGSVAAGKESGYFTGKN
jgi:hypothetical protein